MKWFRPVAGVGLLILVALSYAHLRSGLLEQKVSALEKEKTQLLEYARRLSATRRVAQVTVLAQERDDQGRTTSRLQWQEIRADGLIAPPVEVEVAGSMVYFEAMVIKFDHEYVGQADPDRGWSLAVFRRIFGDQQSPETAAPLTSPATTFVESGAPAGSEGEQWDQFWRLVDDPKLAARHGVRSAQCEAVGAPLREGQVWEVALDAVGGLNLKKLQEQGPVSHAPAGSAPATRLATQSTPATSNGR